MKKKIALLMSAVMLFGVVVGGTIAWLTDETPVVTNTFTNTAKSIPRSSTSIYILTDKVY